jgi:hypothetical protein
MARTSTILGVIGIILGVAIFIVALVYGIIDTRKLRQIDHDTDRLLSRNVALPDAVPGQCFTSVQTTLHGGVQYIVNYSKPNGVACIDKCVDGTGACYSGQCQGECPGECDAIFGYDIDCPSIYLADQVYFAELGGDAIAFQNCEEGICRYYVIFETITGEFLDFLFPTFADWDSHGSSWTESMDKHCMGMIADWDNSKSCLQASFKSLCSHDGVGTFCGPTASTMGVCIFEYNCARSFYDGFSLFGSGSMAKSASSSSVATKTTSGRTVPPLTSAKAVSSGAQQLFASAVAALEANQIPASAKKQPASFGAIPPVTSP